MNIIFGISPDLSPGWLIRNYANFS